MASTDPIQHGDSSLPGEIAVCAFCGHVSTAGEHVWTLEEDLGGSWECEDESACERRANRPDGAVLRSHSWSVPIGPPARDSAGFAIYARS